MAKVFQLVATDRNDPHFEDALIDGSYHIRVYDNRTACGVQLDGDDGIGSGKVIEGNVTCRVCLGIIDSVKDAMNWSH